MSGATVWLREMTEEEFDVYWARHGVEYVQSLSANLPPEAARAKAEQDRSRLLPDGLDTDGQRLLVAEDPSSEVVGHAWLALREPRTGAGAVAWLYDIRVEQAHRRGGVGDAIMAAVEVVARDTGARKLELNVFGGNSAAIALYQRRGYEVTTQQMTKQLD